MYHYDHPVCAASEASRLFLSGAATPPVPGGEHPSPDRKSTRLNSSHGYISYAVFCLKKKTRPHGVPVGGTPVWAPCIDDVCWPSTDRDERWPSKTRSVGARHEAKS